METVFRKRGSVLEIRPWHCEGCPRPFDPDSRYLVVKGRFGEVEGWGCPSHQCALVNISWFNQFYPREVVENVIGYTLTEALQGKRKITEGGLVLIKALLDLDREAIGAFARLDRGQS